MTNMTQASATEKKGASDLLRFKILVCRYRFMPLH